VNFSDVRDAAVKAIVSQFFEGSRDGLLRFLSDDFELAAPLERPIATQLPIQKRLT